MTDCGLIFPALCLKLQEKQWECHPTLWAILKLGIFISALDQAKTVQEGLDLGAVDYITKPFKISEIVGKVRHYIPDSH